MRASNPKTPPFVARWLVSRLSLYEEQFALAEQIGEEYSEIQSERGSLRAGFWYWFQTFQCLIHYFHLIFNWRLAMFRNYLKVACRTLKRYKGYSFINVAGLAIGMACCILILLWVQDEMSYDRFHAKGDRLYRLIQRVDTQKKMAITPAPHGPMLKTDFGEISEYTRMGRKGRTLFQYAEKTFYETGICYVDPSFLTMFTFPLVLGDVETALSDPYAMIIAEDAVAKYFGNEDPIGKTLTLDQSFDVVVTGVMRKIPRNSHLRFDFLGRFEICEKEYGWGVGWSNNNYTTYLQLSEGAVLTDVEMKIENQISKHRPDSKDRLYLQPYQDIYLRSDYDYDFTGSGGFRSVYITIFSVIAFFVLAVACINFMNLSTARSGKRAKEVGIRKVTGASRSQLIRQFLSESVVMSALALILATLIVTLLLPAFNQLSGKEITLTTILRGTGIVILACIATITGIFAGGYPALILSSFMPVAVLKGVTDSGVKGSRLRKALVVLQFSLSIILIIGTMTVYQQLRLIQNRDLGYAKEHLLVTRLLGDIKDHVEPAKSALLNSPTIENVAVSSDITTGTYHSSSGRAVSWEGKHPEENILMYHYDVDEDFIPMMGMEIVMGRNFSDLFSLDDQYSYIVNETAVGVMGMDNPLGQSFALWGNEGTIIGVVKDFHFQSLHEEIEPMIFRIRPEGYYYLLCRVQSQNAGDAIKVLEAVCKRFNPDYPFEYFFMDESFDRLYRSEERMMTIMTVFAGLAVFISCLGLFGLTSFMTEQRRKEIGIRKVLGASVPEVVRLFSKEFIVLVVTANVIAWPVAYLALDRWLQGFAYRTSMGIGIFLASAGLGLIVALGTVCSQSAVAAIANPVESLKYE